MLCLPFIFTPRWIQMDGNLSSNRFHVQCGRVFFYIGVVPGGKVID